MFSLNTELFLEKQMVDGSIGNEALQQQFFCNV